MRYAFVANHRLAFSVRVMCRCLRIHPSGFYAWLKAPLSRRAREDTRQTDLIRKAWKDSGKVYGYRKLHDDLLDQGETICPNRVARLARQAGIKAQICEIASNNAPHLAFHLVEFVADIQDLRVA